MSIIKEIIHERQYKIQTKFGILEKLYQISELNDISSVDKNVNQLDFQNIFTHTISFQAVENKLGTSNKDASMFLCKKSCNLRSQCKCHK